MTLLKELRLYLKKNLHKPEASIFPSLLKLKEYTVSECPLSSVNNVPSARSHTRMRLSTPEVISKQQTLISIAVGDVLSN